MARYPNDHPNAALYCELMEQVKWRIATIQNTLALLRERKHYLPNLPAAEFCLLQLRFVCELIALGCVAVHTDAQRAVRLQKIWNADTIMEEFERLKPSYFPVPARDQLEPDGTVTIIEGSDSALTQEGFKELYNFCGGQLHAGTFRRLKKPKASYDFSIIVDSVARIIALLNCHVYHLYQDEVMIRVIMWEASDKKVWWNLLEKVEKPKP